MVYCGTDIIEIDRIEKAITENEREEGNLFIDKIYTIKEIEYCEKKGKMKYQHYAARFAAKEAIFKAISKLLDDKYEISWKNVEIVNNKTGKPEVKFIGISKKLEEKIQNIDVSLSHSREYAVAMVVMENV